MNDELTAVDIKKMEQEVEYRRLQLRPQLQAAVFDLLLHLFDIDGCQFVIHILCTSSASLFYARYAEKQNEF